MIITNKSEVDKLCEGSHKKILVECDICHKQSYKPYRQYLISCKNGNFYCCSPTCAQVKNRKTNTKKYGCENVFQSQKIKDKSVETNNEKYGVDYPSQSEEIRKRIIQSNIYNFGFDNPAKCDEIKEKMKNTCIERYGADNFNKSEIYKIIAIKKGIRISDELKSDFHKYEYEVRKITKTKKKLIFENWDGYDYYDNEYIFDNKQLRHFNPLYPTIDHKISIFFGFNNNISIEDVAALDNLCITKKSINSKKSTKNEVDFINNLTQ